MRNNNVIVYLLENKSLHLDYISLLSSFGWKGEHLIESQTLAI